MKYLKSLSLFLFISFLLFTGMQCEKDETNKEEVLPAETQTGKGTFGCLVNGEVWLPRGKFPYAGLTTTIQFNILSIGASKSNTGISFGVRNMVDVGTYNLSLDINFVEYSVDTKIFKITEGILTVTKYDKVNQIISGKFWFKAKSSSGEIVEITEGRFDDKFTI
ncbi:DUF6252 family protein [Pedobacter cryophilus]|uniref:Lipoprotein n=1 Tax=Pedobacter cryophilus TaxID=2571271 RepID=A0A4U1C4G8_9SPHI|nr:DUF6252 family protein [Pedobacter cryophilus]TKC00740.1 hypothetical protein FA046_03425 [Pedobacter cryophilus]